MMRARVKAVHSQRGVALITAVLVVALATILAVDVASRGYLDQRRTGTLFVLDQGFEFAMGAEVMAAEVLKDDAKNSAKSDYVGEPWSTPIDYPVQDGAGSLQGYLEDMQGRFNLNSLLNPNGTPNPDALHQFQRLLDALGMETKWAGMLLDWIDGDTTPSIPDGAEDNVYTAQTPPYLAANMPITRVSELLALPGFGLDNYQKLEPFVAALPIGTPLNVCTAPAEVLDSLNSMNKQFSNSASAFASSRQGQCFPAIKDLDTAFGTDPDYKNLKANLAETSNYFRANVTVTIGTTEFSLYSLLHRTSTGQVRAILRSFGTP